MIYSNCQRGSFTEETAPLAPRDELTIVAINRERCKLLNKESEKKGAAVSGQTAQ